MLSLCICSMLCFFKFFYLYHVGFFTGIYGLKGILFGVPPISKPSARKPLPQVRKPNLHSDLGQDSNPCAWRPLGFQSTHGSTVPRRLQV
ncbi:hypothetical protein E2C01_082687 [Portunus trituberculatus]|uniref:Uncharacterized protein n=1 Tax=Portunus trituberculatus TaxID=210409 RepID=A0A5B7IQK9_PORTR|nr:hypothetical protein [Portunus trituberculatus]